MRIDLKTETAVSDNFAAGGKNSDLSAGADFKGLLSALFAPGATADDALGGVMQGLTSRRDYTARNKVNLSAAERGGSGKGSRVSAFKKAGGEDTPKDFKHVAAGMESTGRGRIKETAPRESASDTGRVSSSETGRPQEAAHGRVEPWSDSSLVQEDAVALALTAESYEDGMQNVPHSELLPLSAQTQGPMQSQPQAQYQTQTAEFMSAGEACFGQTQAEDQVWTGQNQLQSTAFPQTALDGQSTSSTMVGLVTPDAAEQSLSAVATEDNSASLWQQVALSEDEEVRVSLSTLASAANVSEMVVEERSELTEIAQLAQLDEDELSLIDDSLQLASQLDEGGDDELDQEAQFSRHQQFLSSLKQEHAATQNTGAGPAQTKVDEALRTLQEQVVSSVTSNFDGGKTPEAESGLGQSLGVLSAAKAGGAAVLNRLSLERAAQSRDNLLHMSADLKANAEEITKQVMAMASRNLKSMTVQLAPEHLGKMTITFDLGARDELSKIKLAAASPLTRDLIEQGMGKLRESLVQSGFEAETELADYEGAPDEEGQSADSRGGESGRDRQQENDGVLFAQAPAAAEEPEDESAEGMSQDGSISYFA